MSSISSLSPFLIQYHGGTNFGRTSGGFVATSYDYDAPIDEYGKYACFASGGWLF